jgi:transglutaminase-like putative cysteine protease
MANAARVPISTRRLFWAGVLAIIVPVLTLTTHLTSGTELARVRNALIFDADRPQDFAWTPSTRPKDFLVDRGDPDPYFVAVAERLHLAALPSDWDRAKAIATHLLSSHPPLMGGAVQSNLTGTYEAIVGQGRGYCADFVLVFRALASTAGVPVRAWAFSFDGFGGHGHVLPEIWDRSAGRWYVLDIYNNNYFVGADGSTPLSASEFRRMLLDEPSELRLLRIAPRQPPGYVDEEKMLTYYRRGLREWYLWWGNNPFTYEGGSPYRWLLPVSRPAAQLTAIVEGVQPRIRPLRTPDNQAQVESIEFLRLHIELAALSVLLGLAFLAIAFLRGTKRRTLASLPIPAGEC